MNSILKIKDLDLCRKMMEKVRENLKKIFNIQTDNFKDVFNLEKI